MSAEFHKHDNLHKIFKPALDVGSKLPKKIEHLGMVNLSTSKDVLAVLLLGAPTVTMFATAVLKFLAENGHHIGH